MQSNTLFFQNHVFVIELILIYIFVDILNISSKKTNIEDILMVRCSTLKYLKPSTSLVKVDEGKKMVRRQDLPAIRSMAKTKINKNRDYIPN